jgi:TolB-like protein
MIGMACISALALASRAADAQCPNGSPPPCGARRMIDPTRVVDPARMVVLRFSNGSIGKYAKELEPLQYALTDILVSELSSGSTLHVIEAGQLSVQSGPGEGLAASTTRAVQVGRELGAARAVFGGYVGDASGGLRISARVVDVKSATILFSVTEMGRQDAILASLASLGEKVRCRVEATKAPADCDSRLAVGSSGASGTAAAPPSAATQAMKPAERAAPKIPLSAMLAYSRSLNARDQGDTTAAIRHARDALVAFPDWPTVQDYLKKLTTKPPS